MVDWINEHVVLIGVDRHLQLQPTDEWVIVSVPVNKKYSFNMVLIVLLFVFCVNNMAVKGIVVLDKLILGILNNPCSNDRNLFKYDLTFIILMLLLL